MNGLELEPRLFVTDFEEGDKVILTTDGVHDNLRSVDIVSAIRASRDGQDDAGKLIGASTLRSKSGAMIARAKQDDMSAVVVEYPRAEIENNSTSLAEMISEGVETLRSSRLAKLIARFVAIAGISGAAYEVEQAIVHREPPVDTRHHDPSIERTISEKVHKKPTGPSHVNPKKPTKKKK